MTDWARALVLGGGDDVPKSRPYVDDHSLIVCADGGSRWAKHYQLMPHVVLGDFDSQTADDAASFAEQGVRQIRFPSEKAKTDVELAVDFCLGEGVRDVVLVGVWGGRIDHSLGNMEVLYALGERNVQASILTHSATLILVHRQAQWQLPVGTLLSLIPLTTQVTGITSSGLYYELHDDCLVRGSTRGISNTTTAAPVEICSEAGILLAVISHTELRV